MPFNSAKKKFGAGGGDHARLSFLRLSSMRQEIDAIDDELSRLLLRRLELACSIGSLKADLGLAIRDACRENAVLDKVATCVSTSPMAKHIVKLYMSIVAESCLVQGNGSK
jgi:chorismate mutase